MHWGRLQRNGHFGLKENAFQIREKMPHKFVDAFIRKNCQRMIDKEIVEKLLKRGIDGVNIWNVRYRRRKLGVKKYLYGEVKKHRAWIRAQAIKKYGTRCELCNYGMTIDTHHVIPRYQGGLHEIDNLMVICPNCHGLVTREIITIKSRKDIPKVRKQILKSLKRFYAF
jgi:5-methylcytosine-specific restriction endonuclease McrA